MKPFITLLLLFAAFGRNALAQSEDGLERLFAAGDLPTDAQLRLGQEWLCTYYSWEGDSESISEDLSVFRFEKLPVGYQNSGRHAVIFDRGFSAQYFVERSYLEGAFKKTFTPYFTRIRVLRDGRLIGLTYQDNSWPSANDLHRAAICSPATPTPVATVTVAGREAQEIFESLSVPETGSEDQRERRTKALACVATYSGARPSYACHLTGALKQK